MSKKKKGLEDQSMIVKLEQLGFNNLNHSNYFEYTLPFGEDTSIVYDTSGGKISICIFFDKLINIRKIESPEDLENLFNAICPEKYRLPFE